jgi:hypothetical protein
LNPSQHWARNFTVNDDDIDYLVGLLLEGETPLAIDALAKALVARRLEEEAALLSEQYKDVVIYNPANAYQIGQRVLFPALDYQVGVVHNVRAGNNPEYGPFSVVQLHFEGGGAREYAAEYAAHRLAQMAPTQAVSLPGSATFTADDVLASARDPIVRSLEERLSKHADLVNIAGQWFPRSLMLDVNDGHLNLAEAVLDINGGGPMTTQRIIEEIGGIADASLDLQVFSLNARLSRDSRFDEVGPLNQVWWYLKRLEPAEVSTAPVWLRNPMREFDGAMLASEMLALEAEIDDEWSTDDREPDAAVEAVTLTLNYPHRRAGTLPLNAKMRAIFPTARRTPRIFVTLVDGQDGSEYSGWVVREERYVFGLGEMYRKHRLPVGALLVVRRDESGTRIIIDFHAHRPRTEYVPILVPKNNQITFDYERRSIGAEYDDLVILGVEDLQAVDDLVAHFQQTRRSTSAILASLVQELSATSPQKTVHGKTLYSAFNILRRCPPGPLFSALLTNGEIEYIGDNYWKMRARS